MYLVLSYVYLIVEIPLPLVSETSMGGFVPCIVGTVALQNLTISFLTSEQESKEFEIQPLVLQKMPDHVNIGVSFMHQVRRTRVWSHNNSWPLPLTQPQGDTTQPEYRWLWPVRPGGNAESQLIWDDLEQGVDVLGEDGAPRFLRTADFLNCQTTLSAPRLRAFITKSSLNQTMMLLGKFFWVSLIKFSSLKVCGTTQCQFPWITKLLSLIRGAGRR